MKVSHVITLLSLLLLVSCSAKDQVARQTNQVLQKKLPDSSTEPVVHYSVAEAELADRTVSEEHFDVASYGGGNGTVLSYSKSDEKETWLREFVDEINVDTYEFPDRQFLYVNPDGNKTVCQFTNKTKLKSSQLLVNKFSDLKNPEAWIKVSDTSGNEGWVYLGSGDPYSNDNWAIVGSIDIEGKKVLLRKYTNLFSIWETQAALDKPSASANVLWQPLRTDKNSQINFEAICVTDETYNGKYSTEHWVKVKDSYGRIGWFPGDKLEVERGGPKYLSPEAIVENSFYEE